MNPLEILGILIGSALILMTFGVDVGRILMLGEAKK